MPSIRPFLTAAAFAALAGCAALTGPKPPPPGTTVVALPPTKSDVWQQIAEAPDVDRLKRLPMAWSAGLADARPRFAAALREEGDLLRPDRSEEHTSELQSH